MTKLIIFIAIFVISFTSPSIVKAGLPGDLNGDGNVSISEVQTAINSFLGLVTNTSNAANFIMPGDLNGDGVVSISEVQTVINAFLGLVRNTTPIANAGADQNVVNGTLVTLDGSKSSDANGDTLTYSWVFTSKPTGSTAVISSASTSKPTFIPDAAGAYVFNLIVNDGQLNSTASTVTINASVPYITPVANAGSPQNGYAGTMVTLDGSASSDSNGYALTYNWSIVSKPVGSAVAALASFRPETPFF
jgi:phosphohistidine swiveling domain-containing protein